MDLGSNLSPGLMTSMGKTQGSIFSIGLGLGFKFKPKPKVIMGKTKQPFSTPFASSPAHQHQREPSTTCDTMKRGAAAAQ